MYLACQGGKEGVVKRTTEFRTCVDKKRARRKAGRPPPGFTDIRRLAHMFAIKKYTDKNGAYLAPQDPYPAIIAGHLNDISVALHSISYELEQIRLALTTLAQSTSEPAFTHAPIHTQVGELTFPEWVARGRR
jgi:hypothetical protein